MNLLIITLNIQLINQKLKNLGGSSSIKTSAPVVEEVLTVEELPAAEEVLEETPSVEEVPTAEEVVEEKPGVEELPAAEEVVEETPPVEEIPTAEEKNQPKDEKNEENKKQD